VVDCLRYLASLYYLFHHIFNYILPFQGGTPDILSTARQVLTDWNHQKISYFPAPPTVHLSSVPYVIPNTGAVVIAPGRWAGTDSEGAEQAI
jgi:hypothetical protein